MVLQIIWPCNNLHAEGTQWLIPFSFFWLQGAPLSSLLEDCDRPSPAACHVRGYDRPAQHLGRRESCGCVERGKNPEGSVLASLRWK